MHAVYRMFDAEGRLLYVGMTQDAGARFGDHAAKRWFPLVANIALEWFPTKASARLAEVRAIGTERPRYNKADRNSTVRELHSHSAVREPEPTEVLAAVSRSERDVAEPAVPDRVTLSEAVRLRVVTCNLTCVRKASQRPGFPAAFGLRGLAREYDVLALADWDAGRRP